MELLKQNIVKGFKITVSFLWFLPLFVLGAPSLQETVSLDNPIKVTSIQGLLVALLNIVMILMVPVIVFFIIYSGFKYVTARGNASQVEEATQSLTYAIIGGVLVLGALAISAIIQNLVDSFTP